MEVHRALEDHWTAEQDRIARAVIDRDDVQWLLDSNSDASNITMATTTTGTGASEEEAKCASSWHEVDERSRIDDVLHRHYQRRRLRLVGGVDISFVKNREDDACATLVVLEFPSLNVVYEAHDKVTMEHPYVAGFLAFREVSHLASLVEKLRAERPDLEPDIVFVDGNGRLHPRGAGLACHLGVVTGLRTIGVGKTFLQVDGLTKTTVRERVRSLLAAGERESQLVGASGAVWGVALVPRSKEESVINPVFVSVGHRISLETCMALTKAVGRYRVPEPIRQADMRSREVIRLWLQEIQRSREKSGDEVEEG